MHNNERCGFGQLLDQDGEILLYKLAVCFAPFIWKAVCINFAVFTQLFLNILFPSNNFVFGAITMLQAGHMVAGHP
jgi:hypothetical protein